METRVFRVLSGLANTAVEAAGSPLYAPTTGAIVLLQGQIGLYDVDTLTSQNPATGLSSLTPGKYFFALGTDANGEITDTAAVAESFVKSLIIDTTQPLKMTQQAAVTAVTQQKSFTWTSTDCETEYCIKVNINSPQIAQAMGWNPLYKSFNVTTDCCDDSCDTCGGGDCDALADLIVTAINDDKDAFLTATKNTQYDLAWSSVDISAYATSAADSNFTFGGETFVFTSGDYTGDAAGDATELEDELQAFLDAANLGGTVTVTRNGAGDYDIAIAGTYVSAATLDASGEDDAATPTATTNGCPNVSVIANIPAIAQYCSMPTNVLDVDVVTFDMYGDCGWDCNFTEVENRAAVAAEGTGAYVLGLEQEATGYGKDHWYRLSGMLRPDTGRSTLTDSSLTHKLYVIEHQDLHEGAPSGHYFRSVWKTIIACPTTSTSAISGLDTTVA